MRRAREQRAVLSYIAVSLRLQFKVMRQYRLDLVGAICSIAVSALVSWLILERNLPAGMAVQETPFLTFFLAGVLRIAYGLVESLTESFWAAGSLARSGGLTLCLARPVPVALQLMMRQINFERLLDCVVGGYFIALAYDYTPDYTSDYGPIPLPTAIAAGFLCFVIAAPAFFAVILIGAALSIRALSDTGAFMSATGEIATFGLLPVSVLRTTFSRSLLAGIVLALFPLSAATLVAEGLAPGHSFSWALLLTALASWAALLMSAALLWRGALRGYQGTGS